jgi:calcineurin-like phosphoesterase family protein
MLIELRIGPGKWKLKGIMHKINESCRIHHTKIQKVPHLTLYYGSLVHSRDQFRKIKAYIESIGKKYTYLPFLIDGFSCMDGDKGKVIHFNVIPIGDFKKFALEIRSGISKLLPTNKEFDKDPKRIKFHITVAYKLNNSEAQRVLDCIDRPDNYGKKLKDFYLPMYALRITTLKNNGRIAYEYDLLQKKFLSRQEALNKNEWVETLKMYRIQSKAELTQGIESNKAIYLMSDMHFDHTNIIKYTARPFVSATEMNEVLLRNWNFTVNKNDTVYFLGDMSFGRGSRPKSYWIDKLNGNVIYVRGNHDKETENTSLFERLEYKGYKFLLVHDPDKLPVKWSGWIIHGDKHNNDIRKYPFIDGDKKTINVSAELVNYKPLNLDYLLSLKIETIKRMDTIESVPLYKDIKTYT